MHTGRVTHVANLPAGAEVLGPTAQACPGEMYTDSQGMQPHSTPRAMTAADIAHAVDEYANVGATRHRSGIRRRRAACRERLPDRAVPQRQREPAHRRLRRQHRRPQSLCARGGSRHLRRHRRRSRRDPAVALWRVQQHGCLPRRRRAGPRARAGTVDVGRAVRPPAGPLGDGRAGGACRVEIAGFALRSRACSSWPAASIAPVPKLR